MSALVFWALFGLGVALVIFSAVLTAYDKGYAAGSRDVENEDDLEEAELDARAVRKRRNYLTGNDW